MLTGTRKSIFPWRRSRHTIRVENLDPTPRHLRTGLTARVAVWVDGELTTSTVDDRGALRCRFPGKKRDLLLTGVTCTDILNSVGLYTSCQVEQDLLRHLGFSA